MQYSPEEIKLAMSCSSPEELLEKATAAGHALTLEAARSAFGALQGGEMSDDSLDEISGGGCSSSASGPFDMVCTICGHVETITLDSPQSSRACCPACGNMYVSPLRNNGRLW